jgi:hypothetical protein
MLVIQVEIDVVIQLPDIRIEAHVLRHANGGHTRIADAVGRWWEIPTDLIPHDLRNIGSRFRFIIHRIRIRDDITVEQLHQMLLIRPDDCIERIA